MKVVVDNVAVLGIEFSLLEWLSGLLSSDVVMNLDDSVMQEIAAEKEDSRTERARALAKLQSLKAGLDTLRRLGRHKVEGEKLVALLLHENSNQITVPNFDYVLEVDGAENGVETTEMITDRTSAMRKRSESPAALEPSEQISQFEVPEPSSPLSPFDGGGSFRADESWVNTKRSSVAKKKRAVESWN